MPADVRSCMPLALRPMSLRTTMAFIPSGLPRPIIVLLASVSLVAFGGCAGDGHSDGGSPDGGSVAEAICAARLISLDADTASPGSRVVVTGANWQAGCNDVRANGSTVDPPPLVDRHVDIQIVQHGRAQLLAVARPDDQAAFAKTVVIPTDLEVGNATIVASRGTDGVPPRRPSSATSDPDMSGTIRIVDKASSTTSHP